MMREGTGSRLCIRTENVNQETSRVFIFLSDASRLKEMSLTTAIAW